MHNLQQPFFVCPLYDSSAKTKEQITRRARALLLPPHKIVMSEKKRRIDMDDEPVYFAIFMNKAARAEPLPYGNKHSFALRSHDIWKWNGTVAQALNCNSPF